MYSIIVFFHVVSALFLGSLLAIPLVMNSFFSSTGNGLKTALKTALSLLEQVGRCAFILSFHPMDEGLPSCS